MLMLQIYAPSRGTQHQHVVSLSANAGYNKICNQKSLDAIRVLSCYWASVVSFVETPAVTQHDSVFCHYTICTTIYQQLMLII